MILDYEAEVRLLESISGDSSQGKSEPNTIVEVDNHLGLSGGTHGAAAAIDPNGQ